MGKGGARNRSGPGADENSGRSDARGFSLTALPSEGYDGEAPEFSLPNVSGRELEVWAREWRSPQAAWWARNPFIWADVAQFVRFAVKIEADEAKGTDINGYLRLKDQIARSPAGMKENGLKIAIDEVAAKAAELEDDADDPRDRLTVVPDVGSA